MRYRSVANGWVITSSRGVFILRYSKDLSIVSLRWGKIEAIVCWG